MRATMNRIAPARVDCRRVLLFPLKTVGNITAAVVLLCATLAISLVDGCARLVVRLIATLTLASVDVDSFQIHKQRSRNKDLVYVKNTGLVAADGDEPGPDQIIDSAATLAAKGAKEAAAALVEKTKQIIRTEFGSRSPDLL